MGGEDGGARVGSKGEDRDAIRSHNFFPITSIGRLLEELIFAVFQ